MKKRSLVLAVVSFCVILSHAVTAEGEADDAVERNENARQVAEAWFNSLMSGKTAVTAALSTTPFSFDRKQEIRSLAELKRLYDEIVADKGRRPLKATAVKVESSTPEKVQVVIMVEDEGIMVLVTPGDVSRVSGFFD